MKLFILILTFSVALVSTQEISATKSPVDDDFKKISVPKSKFTVITPNTIRRGKPFYAYVTGYELPDKITINLKFESTDSSYKIDNNVNLSRGSSSKNIKFDLSNLPVEKTDFQFTVKSGNYSDTKYLSFISKHNSIFIQTNKAIFRPGDLIQFRIFSIDSEANAFNPIAPVTVILTDPRNNEIYKASNLTFVNGKYEGKFKLSSSPILGTWRLQVQYNNEMNVKQLTVIEYVLPLFSASLSVPRQISIASGKFPITINAEYTFGEAVNGVASLTFTRSDDSTKYVKNVSLTSSTNTFEIDIRNDLRFTSNDEKKFTVTLDFYDPLSKTKATDRKDFTLVPYIYNIAFIGERFFRAGTNYNYKFAVQRLDGTPAPKGTIVNVTIQTESDQRGTKMTKLATESDGFASGQLSTNSLITAFSISGIVQGQSNTAYAYITNIIQQSTERDSIQLTLLTQNPSFNDKIKFQAAVGSDKVDSFNYFVTSKGVLLKSSRVYFRSNKNNLQKTVEFTIISNYTYAPSFKIYAYYLSKVDWAFVTTTINVDLQQKLPNFLTLSLAGDDASGNVVVKPSNEISLAIESKTFSTVSLYAVDQRILLLKSGQNFTLSEVIKSFKGYNFEIPIWRGRPSYDPYGVLNAGLNFYTNIPLLPRPDLKTTPSIEPRREDDDKKKNDPSDDIQVRKNFVETFLWRDVNITSSYKGDKFDQNHADNRGREVIKAKVPDSITTYVIYGISMSKNAGMGLPETLPTATVFLPFFISMELPYSVKRNEILIQEIVIFNYLKRSQKATVTVAKDAKFEIVDADKYDWSVSSDGYVQQINCKDGSVRIKIAIRPTVVGFVTLKVSVKGPLAGDAIEKPLKVIHEGIPRSVTSSVLLAIDKASNTADKTLKCVLPASAYEDYTEVSSTVVGDILGKALNNLERLIVMPGGCGEQTLIGFVPDVLVYKYLKATNKLTDALKAKLTEYLIAGYQNQLKYQRFDGGGFSAFGQDDPASSTWLTAYTAWSFYSAKDYIAIDSHIIQGALDFIIQQANNDGSFKEPGRVIHTDMQGAAGNGIALTAYVTIVLSTLVNDYPSVKPKRDAAVQYLVSKLNSVTDVYELGVIANALQLSGSNQASTAFNKFYALKIETTTEMFWKKSTTTNGVHSLDIEITAYGLRLLVARNGYLDDVIKVVSYLVGRSNEFGGYTSSQDTVMALLALSDFALTHTLMSPNLNLELIPNAGKKFNVKVDSSNALTLQSFSLNDKTRELKIHPAGTGVAIVSLTCNFYDNPSKTVPSFGVDVKFLSVCQYRTEIQVCVKSLTGNSSNMAIMEVRMPSGFVYQSSWSRTKNSDVSKIETFESNTIVVFYINSISNNGTCVVFNAYRSGQVGELKPGTIEVTNYYDTSKVGSASFTIPKEDLNKTCY